MKFKTLEQKQQERLAVLAEAEIVLKTLSIGKLKRFVTVYKTEPTEAREHNVQI